MRLLLGRSFVLDWGSDLCQKVVVNNPQNLETTFVEARSLFREGRFFQAEPLLEALFEKEFQKLSQFSDQPVDHFLELIRFLLRTYTERSNSTGLAALLAKVSSCESLYLRCQTSPGFLYVQSIYSLYSKDVERALEVCQKSLNLAIELGSINEIAMALILQAKIGLMRGISGLGLAQSSIKELKQLLFKNVSAEVQLSSLLLEADFAMTEGKSNTAIEQAWKAYEFSKQTDSSLFYMASIIAKIGHLYLQKNEKNNAFIYLQLAARTVLPESMVRLNSVIQQLIAQIQADSVEFDVLLDTKKRKVILKPQVEIDLKNQFVLLDLFKLFLSHPGQIFNKQQLAELVWNESYNPTRHDNLIYVNLKRLRDILDEGSSTKELLKRSRQGYFFSADHKLGFQQEELK